MRGAASIGGEGEEECAANTEFRFGPIGDASISLEGKLAPGPANKLYLSPEFVETENDFKRLKLRMALVGDVKTFNNFNVSVPPGVKPSEYTTVIVWCETFSQFITADRYK